MPNATATQVKKSNNPFDIFITGLRKGFNVAINNLMPNVLMAFVLAYILDLFGVMAFLGKVCGPVMSIFDLPGQAITVLCATWLSCGAGVGVAASLLASFPFPLPGHFFFCRFLPTRCMDSSVAPAD